MAEQKKFCFQPKENINSPYKYTIYTANGDISKEWFINYVDEAGKRCRKYGKGLNSIDDPHLRLLALKKVYRELVKEHINKAKEELTGIKLKLQLVLDKHCYDLKKKTAKTYNSHLRCFLHFLDKKKVNRNNVESFFEYLRKERSKTTRNGYYTTLQFLFNKIGRNDLMKNVEKSKRVFTEPYKLYQPYHIEKIKNYMLEHDPELWLYVRFIYYCALRPDNELLGLRVQDLNFSDWTVRVSNKIAKNNRQRIASIPLVFRGDVMVQFYDKYPGEFLFPSHKDRSKRGEYKRVYDRHRKVLKALSFPNGYCVYSWRYTGAVMAAKAGVPLNQIKEQFDHHSLDQLYGYMRQAGFIDRDLLVNKFPEI